MDENILDSIKILLGIQVEDFSFDHEIIMHINSVFMILNQLGIGSAAGFKITGNSETWESFLEDRLDLEGVKSYIYSKVRLLFDPPQNSFLVEALQKQISELEWRLQLQAEPYALTAEAEAEEELEEDEELYY